MAGPAGLNAPPIGVVIKNDDGSNSIWTGKAWAPARQSAGGWGIDQEAMQRLGMGGQGANGNISGADQKQVFDMENDANQTDTLAGNANDFMKRNRRTGTGGVYALPFASKAAKAMGVSGADDLAQMDRDNISSATAMRAPGMRLTQMEFGKFLGATPSVQNAGPQNAQIATAINKANTLAQAKASFFSSYLDHHRTLSGAIPAWLAFKNSRFDEDMNYLPDPISHQRAAGEALRSRSSQGSAPAMLKPADYLGSH